ncbi:response regulator [candidate division KSB1 bacterium]|nr:response regulator [candidate division KSB1 bacterium]
MKPRSSRILIVDDEEDLTWSISRSLMRENELLEIICVNTGDEAFKVLEKNSIDLVISDLRMPGKSGLEILDQIQKKHPQTKMIIMTAYGTPALEKQIRETKNAFYLEKPFDIHVLKKMISDLNNGAADKNTSIKLKESDLKANANMRLN